MKLRFNFLAFVSLLLLGSLASTAQALMPTDSASVKLSAIFAAPASPDCADAKLPSFEPTPTHKAIVCGSCSESLCQGKNYGQTCKIQSGKVYTCRTGNPVCSANDCQCWNGPLP